MTPSTKVFATLSLAAATGKKISSVGKSNNDKTAQAVGRELQLTGKYATRRFPADEPFTPRKIMEVYDAVTDLISGPTDPPTILSMIIAGLSDICSTSDKRRRILISEVVNSAQRCLDMYTLESVDHEAAFEDYKRWVAS